MRLIDADVLLKKLSDNSWNIDEWELPRKEVSAGLIANGMDRKTVEEMPTVDAVPVIRCRECKYKPTCEEYIITQQEDAYCSWAVRAERREE